MPNVALQQIMQVAMTADGRQIAQPHVSDALDQFVYPLRAIQPGAAGYVAVTGGELARFTSDAEVRSGQAVASVTRALRLSEDSWLLVPDDDEADPVAGSTFQFFEFQEGPRGLLLTPMVADLVLPAGFQAADILKLASVTNLWRHARRKKDTATCVDTAEGECYGEACGSGCAKLIWGAPDSPTWSCLCPTHA